MKQGWEIKKLGDVCTSDLGKTLNQSKDTGDMHPYLCAINILWDKIDFTTVKQTRFESSEIDRYSVRKDDLLICEGGDIGRAAIWDKDETMLYQNALHRVRFYGSIIPRFCLLYLRFLKNTGVLDGRYGKGVTIKHLVKSSLLSIPIPVPPIAEQEKIVTELDCLSGIIEKKKQQLKELDNLAQSIFYEMFGDPVENDKGWDIVTLDDVFEIGSSKRVFESQWTDSGVPFYRAREIVKLSKGENIDSPIFISEELYHEYSRKYGVPAEGDMMVTAVGTLGVCYLVKNTDRFYFKDGNTLWFKSRGLCETRFIKDEFATDFIVNQIKGNANAAVVGTYTITNAKMTRVILPPLSLQQEYVRKVQHIDKQKEQIAQSIKETETLFNSRMDYYFG